ncbi:MAG TPA: hypothetical protein VHZ24_09930 [Pirellulales bacterium]|nr:hypothetical protein [Pirellulales bacterium]
MDGLRSSAADAFDFTAHMRSVCVDIAARLSEFRHVDMARVAIRWCQARHRWRHGVQATLTPMRFAGGASVAVRRGRRWSVRPLFDADGREMLYLLSFYLPRFLNQPFEEKLATICHELWHIGPAFDGDLRRHEHGRYYAHGPSEAEYHGQMRVLARAWLDRAPPAALCDPLRGDFRALLRRHGRVVGLRLPTPKLVPAP